MLLLDAAVSLQLLQRRSGGRYGLGALGAALVGNPGVVAMIEHHALLYGDLHDPVALLRGEPGSGSSRATGPMPATSASAVCRTRPSRAYTALMAASQPLVARAGARRLFVSRPSLPARRRRRRRRLPCGGRGAAHRNCAACCSIFPPVADKASDEFRDARLSSRARRDRRRAFSATGCRDGADVVSLVGCCTTTTTPTS